MQRIAFQQPPESHSPADLADHLAAFAETDAPVLVVRRAGRTMNQAMAYLASSLPDTMSFDGRGPKADYDIAVSDEQDSASGRYTDDLPLHIDMDDKQPTPSIVINAWLLCSGRVEGSFLVPGPALIELLRHRRQGQAVPDEVRTAYLQGLADPGVLQPAAFRIQLSPGDLVICKDGLPVAHEYRTLAVNPRSKMRRSIARLGRLAGRSSLLDR